MQEYRYRMLGHVIEWVSVIGGLFGVRKPLKFDIPEPVPAGDYDHALHVDHPEAPSLLEQYVIKPEPKLGGAPHEVGPSDETDLN
jgi:hypothetical protein